MDKETAKEKKRLQRDLLLYLELYKEVAGRGDGGQQVKEFFDEQIEKIEERLKEIGR
ncbi:hypothetical protein [uncultured Rikenella sp.]|uniref:hypothetical protein n=1 Tax=uncultured Rikenella sp. TaxID=368003 RepID=UPI00261D3E0B|nr:hypothetical protein [uncultured Rikenella sp.]